MRFKPSTGVGPKNKKAQKAAAVARAEAIENVTSDDEPVFDERRHSREIQRSENLAAGLPPDISDETIKEREEQKSEEPQATPSKAKRGGQGNRRGRKGRTREPEKPFEPVEVPDQPPQGIVETIKAATDKVIERVKRVFIPLSKSHKELIINAEPLESRVAVLEEGTLEEFTIERNYIRMLIAGGRKPDTCYVELLVDGHVLKLTGDDSTVMKEKRIDVSAYQGKSAILRLVDQAVGGWAHLVADRIVWPGEGGRSDAQADEGEEQAHVDLHTPSMRCAGRWRISLK